MRTLRYTFSFLFIVLLAGLITKKVHEQLTHTLPSSLYQTHDQQLLELVSKMEQRRLGWDELIPAKEKALITQYQLNQPETFNEQLDLALRGSADADYQAALISTNTVDELLDLSVSISGFIVPIDVNDEGSTQSFLLVPYFGACIHYPPPPPNQIIYVRLSGSISDYDMEHAYTVEGILSKGMFEDPLGTAAYILDATQVRAYEEAPDTFRQH